MTVVLTIQILAALTMAGLILVQHGKGADMGAAFGTGSAGSLFGASGSANFLSRMTAVSATVFFAATLALAFMAGKGLQQPSGGGSSVLENAPIVAPIESGPASAIPGADAPAPVAPAPAATGNERVDAIPGAETGAPASGSAPAPAPAEEGNAAPADAEPTQPAPAAPGTTSQP
ncbi:preprotein translocase subunit SecG [Corticibacter populi]|uniref:Protein-export membrane protein SecG n=2 Tax=Corticibacter populi TaxID=1550736 RepID=A0A3M6R0Y0_9BURK|nr:preprotein translocase subunit SecG [Corticibacter populi]